MFCLKDVFKREIDEGVERALYVEHAERAILDGRSAIAAGNYVEGIGAAREAVARRRAERD